MTMVNSGYFEIDSKRNVKVQDATLDSIQQDHFCSLKLPVVKEFGNKYKFNLDTGKRFQMNFMPHDLCQEINDLKTEEKLQYYFKKSEALSAIRDQNFNDKDNSVKFLEKFIRIDEFLYEGKMNLFDEIPLLFEFNGNYNDNGNFHGYSILKVLNTPLTSCQGYIN